MTNRDHSRPQGIELSARDSAFLADLLLNPPEPTAALRAAWQRHTADPTVVASSGTLAGKPVAPRLEQ